MSIVRVRYAPSPTGVPHIGNIRTALFNFLFAKNKNGQFILRIEDTDQKRLVPDSIPKIKESLLALNLKWDEEYVQSKRLALYNNSLEILKDKSLIYQDEGAWYFKVPKDQKIKWQDGVRGTVEFSSDILEDFVIVKSDNFPTYHFASVVDDNDTKITHVIRGDEWISSTPKHLLLYQAFSWQPPTFVHLPSILGPDKKKLSKREGAKSVLEYLTNGFLPEAIVNFLALLGWSPKNNQELFSLSDLIKEFSLECLNKNSPIFNIEKLNWFNKKYLQKYQIANLLPKIKQISKNARKVDDQKLAKILELVRDRMTTFGDFDKYSSIFFEKGKEKSPEKSKIESVQTAIASIDKWAEESISQKLDLWIEKNHLQPADFKNTLRLTVFADNTPPIYQSLAVLSKKEVILRIDNALKKSR